MFVWNKRAEKVFLTQCLFWWNHSDLDLDLDLDDDDDDDDQVEERVQVTIPSSGDIVTSLQAQLKWEQENMKKI